MNEYLKAYQKTINPNNEVHESIGIWFGNFFKNKQDAINETLMNVFQQYHFEPFIDGNNDIVGKRQGNVYIVLKILFAKNLKSANILVTVYSVKSLKELGNGQLIQMKHSWEEDELADALQRALNPIRIKLSTDGKRIELNNPDQITNNIK